MTSNVFGGHTSKDHTEQGGALNRIVDLLWVNINSKFKTIAEAFRYFDVNFNNRVSFSEFQKGLDHLRIKFSLNIVDVIFQWLD